MDLFTSPLSDKIARRRVCLASSFWASLSSPAPLQTRASDVERDIKLAASANSCFDYPSEAASDVQTMQRWESVSALAWKEEENECGVFEGDLWVWLINCFPAQVPLKVVISHLRKTFPSPLSTAVLIDSFVSCQVFTSS